MPLDPQECRRQALACVRLAQTSGTPQARLHYANRFFTAWVMWPAISANLFAYGYQTAALVTISVWALYVLYRIIVLPARFRLRKARKTATVKLNEIFE